MSRYSKEKKEHALSLMAPPNNLSVADVSARTGVTEPTLYAWRNQARAKGRPVPGDGSGPESWRPEDRFAVVVESMGLAEAGLCRRLHSVTTVPCRAPGLLGLALRRSLGPRYALGPAIRWRGWRP